MYSLSLSVHQLVDFALRKGDIDTRVYNQNTMQEGIKLHSIYQKSKKGNYLSEVQLEHTFNYGDYTIKLFGRCDGIDLNARPKIEEIKTTNDDLENYYKQNKAWHLGQAICYAYIYSLQKNIDEIDISLVYISQIDASKKIVNFTYKINELLKEIYSYFGIYIDFYRLIKTREEKRDQSLTNLSFPFEKTRQGQEEMIQEVINSYKEHKVTFVEASTGIGKTISTIYGSLVGLKDHRINKIFYATPKNVGFINSFNAFKLIRDRGFFINAVELIAKEKICPNHCEKNCNPDDCPLSKGYYDKVNFVLREILIKENLITTSVVREYAKNNGICPFELSLDLSLYTDFVVCDYNYVFHPIASLKRFFDDPPIQFRKFLLVDEVHNLVDRSRDMYSAEFNSFYFNKMKKKINKEYKTEKSIISRIKKVTTYVNMFKDFEYGEEDYMILETVDLNFLSALKDLDKKIKDFKAEHPKLKIEELDEFSRMNYNFLKIIELSNIDYKIVLKKNEDDFIIKYFCINPSVYLLDRLHDFEGATLFSATINPIDYYQEVLLGKSGLDFLSLPSPFEASNLKVLVDTKTSIKYKDRLRTLPDVIEEIYTLVNSKIGNYIVFAPSFEYLNMIKAKTIKDDRFIYQEKSMNIDDRELFLSKLKPNPNATTVAICVMGGSFSEGIDLLGDRLIGLVIIGVGLPTISLENKLIDEYYSTNGLSGYAYAFINPGINKIMQAVGRLIRTESDKGVALLIDERYSYSTYRSLFKNRWTNCSKITSLDVMKEELVNFYKQK